MLFLDVAVQVPLDLCGVAARVAAINSRLPRGRRFLAGWKKWNVPCPCYAQLAEFPPAMLVGHII